MDKYHHLALSFAVCFHQIIVLQPTIIALTVTPFSFASLSLSNDAHHRPAKVIPVGSNSSHDEEEKSLHGNAADSGFEWRAAKSKIPECKERVECGTDCKVDAKWRTSCWEKILSEENVCLLPGLLNKGDVVNISDEQNANQLFVLEEEKRSDMSAHLEALQRLAALRRVSLLPSYSHPQESSTRAAASTTNRVPQYQFPPMILRNEGRKLNSRICPTLKVEPRVKEKWLWKRCSVQRLEMPQRLHLPPPLPLVRLDSSGLPSLSYKRRPKLANYNDKGMYTASYRLARGAFGEVWRAVALDEDAEHVEVVLKRMIVLRFANDSSSATSERDDAWTTATGAKRKQTHTLLLREAMGDAHRSGRREEHFGNLFRGSKRISRFIKSFQQTPRESMHTGDQEEHHHKQGQENMCTKDNGELNELWLVFSNEGFSLANVLFHPDVAAGGKLTQSVFWLSLKSNYHKLREIFFQLTQALEEVHRNNVVHRDVKLENVFIQPKLPLSLRLGDWGSAIQYADVNSSAETQRGAAYVASLYGQRGPSLREETADYSPPEITLQSDEARMVEMEWSERDSVLSSGTTSSSTGTSPYSSTRSTRSTVWSMDTSSEESSRLPHYDDLSPTSLWRKPSFDMWSLGVTFLETVLGRRDVFTFQEDSRTLRKLEKFVKNRFPQSEAKRQTSIAFYILGQLCMAPHDDTDLPSHPDVSHWAEALLAAKDFENNRRKKLKPTTTSTAPVVRPEVDNVMNRDLNMTLTTLSEVLISRDIINQQNIATTSSGSGILQPSATSTVAIASAPEVSLALTVPPMKALRVVPTNRGWNVERAGRIKASSVSTSSNINWRRLSLAEKPLVVPQQEVKSRQFTSSAVARSRGDYNVWRSASYVANVQKAAQSLSTATTTSSSSTTSGIEEEEGGVTKTFDLNGVPQKQLRPLATCSSSRQPGEDISTAVAAGSSSSSSSSSSS
eukprot:Lankesteria_metandrocarpae@DN10336_c0_g1_i1.p1